MVMMMGDDNDNGNGDVNGDFLIIVGGGGIALSPQEALLLSTASSVSDD